MQDNSNFEVIVTEPSTEPSTTTTNTPELATSQEHGVANKRMRSDERQTRTLDKIQTLLTIGGRRSRSPSPAPPSPSPSQTSIGSSETSSIETTEFESSGDSLKNLQPLDALKGAGWDTEALANRYQKRTPSYTTFTAHERLEIERLYDTATTTTSDSKSDSSTDESEVKKASKRLLRILMICALEHDKSNLSKIAQISRDKQLSFFNFMSKIPDFNKDKAIYMKSFLVAAVLHAGLIEASDPTTRMDFSHFIESVSQRTKEEWTTVWLHARANIMSAIIHQRHMEHLNHNVSWSDFNPPYLKFYSGKTPSGIPKEKIARLESGVTVKGFYDRAQFQDPTGVELEEDGDLKFQSFPMTMEFKPSKRLQVPTFSSPRKQDIKVEITEEGHPSNDPEVEVTASTYRAEGTLYPDSGYGIFETTKMHYDFWVTPWGVIGHKTLKGGKQRGAFFCQWT